jgi:hypothetical protein
MTILTHNFNEINIAQLSEQATISGSAIPKGYVNATQLCKAGKKKLNDWTRLNSLMLELKGTPDGDASLQGTWIGIASY